MRLSRSSTSQSTRTGDSDPEFFVVGADFGATHDRDFDGRHRVVHLRRRRQPGRRLGADAPMNGSTMLLPALASELGLRAGAPRPSSTTRSRRSRSCPESLTGDITDVGKYRAFEPPVSSGDFLDAQPGRVEDARPPARQGPVRRHDRPRLAGRHAGRPERRLLRPRRSRPLRCPDLDVIIEERRGLRELGGLASSEDRHTSRR